MVNLKCLFGHEWSYSYSISIDEKDPHSGHTHAYPILRVYKNCSKCGKKKFLFSRYIKDYKVTRKKE